MTDPRIDALQAAVAAALGVLARFAVRHYMSSPLYTGSSTGGQDPY